MRIALIGGGDLAQQLAHYIRHCDAQAEVVGFVDDFAVLQEARFGVPCLGSISAISTLHADKQFDAVLLGIGYKHLAVRQQIFESLRSEVPFHTFIHPSAYVDSTARVGKGCCIGPGAIIEQRTVLGDNAFLYGGVNVSHDSEIGAHTFVAPSAAIAGFVRVGERCFLGLHASVVERVHIADDVVVGAGALVLHHLSEPGAYVGVPARKKQHT